MRTPTRHLVGLIALSLSGPSCTSASTQSPHTAVETYRNAINTHDADALYDALSAKSKSEISREQFRRLLADQKQEHRELAQHVGEPATRIRAQAVLRFADGEQAVLVLEDGDYRVSTALAMPGYAHTPAQALGELRAVLARRSYQGFVQLLSSETRSILEQEVKTLVEGLEEPDGLDIAVAGESAKVTMPTGHIVHMKREQGVWRVHRIE